MAAVGKGQAAKGCEGLAGHRNRAMTPPYGVSFLFDKLEFDVFFQYSIFLRKREERLCGFKAASRTKKKKDILSDVLSG